MTLTPVDVAIVGGGINGTAIAADAAQRGLSVALFEKNDLASETSSSSTKLIHGGLRYLEYGQLSLVKKSLQERNRLINLAPHLIHPQALILPYVPTLRAAWRLRAGLFLYDYLADSSSLPKSQSISRIKNKSYFSPLKTHLERGVMLHECLTDDARLTLANALQAKQHGAAIYTHSECQSAKVLNNLWHLNIKTRAGEQPVQARVLVNACGPWVLSMDKHLQIASPYSLSLIKGSHLVITQLYAGDSAYLLQHEDGRIIFVIPYHGQTLIGTTDVLCQSSERLPISAEEIHYLLAIVSQYFAKPILKKDIITTWSGIRTLLHDPQKSPQSLSRDYKYHFFKTPAPALTVYSGKITTYRQLAQEAVNSLSEVFQNLGPSNTQSALLPGADYAGLDFKTYQSHCSQAYAWLDNTVLSRMLTTYGSRIDILLQGCNRMKDLGPCFGEGLFQREVDYLLAEEWAQSTEDILWRRTKLGLKFNRQQEEQLGNYLATQ